MASRNPYAKLRLQQLLHYLVGAGANIVAIDLGPCCETIWSIFSAISSRALEELTISNVPSGFFSMESEDG